MPLVRKPSAARRPPRRLRLADRGHERPALGGGAGGGRAARRRRRCLPPLWRGRATRACARRSSPAWPAPPRRKAPRPWCLTSGRTTPACAPAPSTPCGRCPRRAVPILPALLADPDADVRLLSCELARGLPDERRQPAAVRSARAGDREERVRGGGRSAGRNRPAGGPAGPGALRRAVRRRPVPRLQHQGRDRSHRGRRARDRAPARSRRRNSARSAISSTGAPACSSPRPSATTSQRRIADRMAVARDLVLHDLLRLPAQRRRRRDREVHQRLHRQRDLLLSRGAPAPLPVVRPPERAGAGEAAGRGAAHLVGALRHRRGALFDRPVAARELARGRCPGHRDRRLRHRHRMRDGGRGRANSASAR